MNTDQYRSLLRAACEKEIEIDDRRKVRVVAQTSHAVNPEPTVISAPPSAHVAAAAVARSACQAAVISTLTALRLAKVVEVDTNRYKVRRAVAADASTVTHTSPAPPFNGTGSGESSNSLGGTGSGGRGSNNR